MWFYKKYNNPYKIQDFNQNDVNNSLNINIKIKN